MKGRANTDPIKLESVNSRKYPTRMLIFPLIYTIIFIAGLLIVIMVFSENAEAAFGLDINVQSPKDRYMQTTTNPQSITFTIEVTNTGTSEESMNLISVLGN